MKKSFAFLFLTLVFLNYDISPVIALGDCSKSEMQELRDDGWSRAEIREYCKPEEGTNKDDDEGIRNRGIDQGGPAYTCDCGQGVMCPLNLSGALPRGAPCFCNFGYMGNCRGRAR